MTERFIEIKMTKCTLFFTESELLSLLRTNTKVWQEGIKRGKHIKRGKSASERVQKKRENEG